MALADALAAVSDPFESAVCGSRSDLWVTSVAEVEISEWSEPKHAAWQLPPLVDLGNAQLSLRPFVGQFVAVVVAASAGLSSQWGS